jgi:hypothetical protein
MTVTAAPIPVRRFFTKEKNMPNWCSNTLRVLGSEESISRFRDGLAKACDSTNLEGVLSAQVLTFQDLFPEPDPNLVNEPAEALEFRIADDWDDGLVCEFDTAWSPPLDTLRRLSSLWPELVFVLEYEESGDGFKGLAKATAGNLEDHCIHF